MTSRWLVAFYNIAVLTASFKYNDSAILTKWRFWLQLPTHAHSILFFRVIWQLPYYLGVGVLPLICSIELLTLWFAIRDEVKEAGNPYGHMFRYGPRRLAYEIGLLCDITGQPGETAAVTPEVEMVKAAKVAAQAQIADEENLHATYNRYYPLGIFRVGFDKARNVDMPCSTAGKQRSIACSKQWCIATKTYIAAGQLDVPDGFADSRIVSRIAYYEDWLLELEDEERRLHGKNETRVDKHVESKRDV